MNRVERRQLVRLGRRSDDPYTALRFEAVARLGTGIGTPQVAAELEIATSTVVGAANRFLADGVAGLCGTVLLCLQMKSEGFPAVAVCTMGGRCLRSPDGYRPATCPTCGG
jgi:hypothetical protein